MAFCLIAMATLYILDWHKRNTAVASMNDPYLPVPTNSREHPNYSQSAPFGTKNPIGKSAMVFFCRDVFHFFFNNFNILISVEIKKTSPPPSPTKPPGRHPGLPPPLYPCVKLHCESFCCSGSSYSFFYGASGGVGTRRNDGAQYIVVAKNLPPPIGTSNKIKITFFLSQNCSHFIIWRLILFLKTFDGGVPQL